jgi:hypothetical protein
MKRNLSRTPIALINIVAFVIVLCSWTPAFAKPWQLYATGTTGEGVSTLYRINVHTGAAKALDEFTSDVNINNARGLAFDTDNRTLYALANTLVTPQDNVGAVFTVDVKTAVSSLLGTIDPSEQLLGGLTYDSNHGILYATGILSVGLGSRPAVFTVDPVTGAVGVASVNVPFDISLGGLAYDPARDIIYATGTLNSQQQSALFVIDVKNHSTTLVGLQTPDAFLGFGGLALDPSTGLLYATGLDLTTPVGDPGLAALYVVDPATGTATKIGPTGVSDIGLGKLTFVPAGNSDK